MANKSNNNTDHSLSNSDGMDELDKASSPLFSSSKSIGKSVGKSMVNDKNKSLPKMSSNESTAKLNSDNVRSANTASKLDDNTNLKSSSKNNSTSDKSDGLKKDLSDDPEKDLSDDSEDDSPDESENDLKMGQDGGKDLASKTSEMGKSTIKGVAPISTPFSAGSALYSIAKSQAENVAKGVDKATEVSSESNKGSDKESDESNDDTDKKIGKAAAKSAVPAAKVAGMSALMSSLKNLFMTVGAAVANIGNSFLSMLVGGIKSFLGFFANAGSFIAGFFGGVVSASVATVAIGSVVVISVIAGSVLGIGALTANQGFDDGQRSCVENVEKAVEANTTPEVGDVDAAKLKNAETIYSVFSSWGMSDENIAGALGNFDVESQIDPTGVETIYDEPHTIGPRKSRAESVGYDVSQLAPEYGQRFPLIKNVGIGLGQWTDTNDGATGNTTLRNFAKDHNKSWYDLTTQLSFMMSDKDQHKPALTAFIANPEGTPEAAALTFARTWEGNTSMHQQERQDRAKEWFLRLDNWSKDDALAESLLSQAGATVEAANEKSIHNAMNDCVETKNLDFDNSSIASAMVSYSWPYRSQSFSNKGTDLYVEVHDKVLPGDAWYASCDRSVASAVRWAGADDNFPAGAVPTQKTYMDTNSEKWERVNWNGDKSKLNPGDIGISPNQGHVIMYVGEALPKAKYPDGNYEANADVAEGSLDAAGSTIPNENTRSPHLSTLSDRTNYIFYRNIKVEENSKYKDVVSGTSGAFGKVSKNAAGAIKAAESQLGVPYVWGGESPGKGLDCSGLTQFAWGQAGVSLPHDSRAQYKAGKQVPYKDRQAGDLVFWGSNTSDPSSIYHVAILTSPDQIIHAPVPGDVVKRVPISSGGSASSIMPMVVRL